jgi:hypothetical protein
MQIYFLCTLFNTAPSAAPKVTLFVGECWDRTQDCCDFGNKYISGKLPIKYVPDSNKRTYEGGGFTPQLNLREDSLYYVLDSKRRNQVGGTWKPYSSTQYNGIPIIQGST